jgi:hypothetical protein
VSIIGKSIEPKSKGKIKNQENGSLSDIADAGMERTVIQLSMILTFGFVFGDAGNQELAAE